MAKARKLKTYSGSATQITIPTSIDGSPVREINSTTFSNRPDITKITVNMPSDSLPGAPWGARNADTVYTDITVHPKRTVTILSDSHGSATGAGTYNKNAQCVIKAYPNAGYKFVRWDYDDGVSQQVFSTNNPYTFTVTEDWVLIPIFELATYYISIYTDGNGTITGDTSDYYYKDDRVHLNCQANSGYEFDYWGIRYNSSEQVLSYSQSYTYTVSGATAVIKAHFKVKQTYYITINSDAYIDSISGKYYLTSSSSPVSFTLGEYDSRTISGFDSTGYIYLNNITYTSDGRAPVTGYPSFQGDTWTIVDSSGSFADRTIGVKYQSYGPKSRNVVITATGGGSSYTWSNYYGYLNEKNWYSRIQCTGSNIAKIVVQMYNSGWWDKGTKTSNPATFSGTLDNVYDYIQVRFVAYNSSNVMLSTSPTYMLRQVS